MSFDWRPPEVDSKEKKEARTRLRDMEGVWNKVRTGILEAQEKQKTQADRHRRPVDFDKDDMVYLSTKHLKLERPSRKLSEKAISPFKVIEKVGHSYRLELPPELQRLHPVFSPDKLRLATRTKPLTGQIPDPQPPVQVGNETE